LGTSKGGTHVLVNWIDYTWTFAQHYLRVGSHGEPIKAKRIETSHFNAMVTSWFVMPPMDPLKAMVQLYFSHDGQPYVNIGDFIYYGKC
jgi:hypothetical protein